MGFSIHSEINWKQFNEYVGNVSVVWMNGKLWNWRKTRPKLRQKKRVELNLMKAANYVSIDGVGADPLAMGCFCSWGGTQSVCGKTLSAIGLQLSKLEAIHSKATLNVCSLLIVTKRMEIPKIEVIYKISSTLTLIMAVKFQR